MKMETLDYVVILPEVEGFMTNWERWVRVRKHEPVRCVGLESKWRAPDVFDGTQPQCEINILEAVEVEKIICKLPERNRLAIKAWHIYKMPSYVMRRKLAERDIGLLMRNSWLMVYNNMKKLTKEHA